MLQIVCMYLAFSARDPYYIFVPTTYSTIHRYVQGIANMFLTLSKWILLNSVKCKENWVLIPPTTFCSCFSPLQQSHYKRATHIHFPPIEKWPINRRQKTLLPLAVYVDSSVTCMASSGTGISHTTTVNPLRFPTSGLWCRNMYPLLLLEKLSQMKWK